MREKWDLNRVKANPLKKAYGCISVHKSRKWFYQSAASLLLFLFIVTVFNFDFALTRNLQKKISYFVVESESDWMPSLQKAVQTGLWLDTYTRRVFNPDMGGTSKTVMSLPVSGNIYREFGWVNSPVDDTRQLHGGIDILASENSPVRAAWEGEVKSLEYHDELGRVVVISHKDGLSTLYANCKEVLVQEGQRVQKGEIIGKLGRMKGEERAHLHFEVREEGKPVTPANSLELPQKI